MGLVIIFNLLTMIFVQKTYPMNADVNSILGPYVLAEKQNGFYNLEKYIYEHYGENMEEVIEDVIDDYYYVYKFVSRKK